MRNEPSRWLLAGVAGLLLCAPAAAQDRTRPLGDLLDALPSDEAPDEAEAAAEPAEAPPPERPFAPLLRPPPPSRAVPAPAPVPAPPAPVPGRIGTMDLPPSAVLYPADDPPPAPPQAGALPAPVAIDPPPPPTEADIAWQALQEQRRQEINALEAPLVARLNARVAADQEAARLRAEQDRADYEQALLDRETEIARIEADHRAAREAHARAVARQRAEHEARVAACLAGDRAACAPR